MKMNVTVSNFLEILVERGSILKSQVSLGGRYHVALQDLVRLGYANLTQDGKYLPTDSGKEALASTPRHTSGCGDARSKMKPRSR